MLLGALSLSLSDGWRSILLIQRTFNTLVHPPGLTFADKAGGKGDLSDNLNAAAPSCWKFDQDSLVISLVSEMYLMAVICMFWVRDSFCVARSFWLPCHISQKVVDLCHSLQFSFLRILLQFQVVVSFRGIQCCTIAHQYSIFDLSKLPNYDLFPKCLASGFRLSPANNISSKRKPGLHSDTMWYNREYVASHIGEIGVLWVRFLLLPPSVGYIR